MTRKYPRRSTTGNSSLSFIQNMGVNEIEQFQQLLPTNEFCSIPDNNIQENKSFSYTIFTPKGSRKTNQAILLLHGLNERNWDNTSPGQNIYP